MAERKHKSIITDEYTTAQQYIVEVMMTREAKKNGKALPLKFWQLDEYKKKYKLTLFRINALIKAYSDEVLVKVVCANPWMYSLYFPGLPDLLDEASKKMVAEVKSVDTKVIKLAENEQDTTNFQQQIKKSNNMKSKLDD